MCFRNHGYYLRLSSGSTKQISPLHVRILFEFFFFQTYCQVCLKVVFSRILYFGEIMIWLLRRDNCTICKFQYYYGFSIFQINFEDFLAFQKHQNSEMNGHFFDTYDVILAQYGHDERLTSDSHLNKYSCILMAFTPPKFDCFSVNTLRLMKKNVFYQRLGGLFMSRL